MSLTLMAGPCVIECPELTFMVAERLQAITERLGMT
jgi:2-dehydro-3-deoxyphosphooctonate aldolase (KDO 8-P synthase)